MSRMPSIYIPHGGGPCFFMEDGAMGPKGTWQSMRQYLERAVTRLPKRPSALVVISAHWEERGSVGVETAAKPQLLYDYYGFPPHTYELEWAAPGSAATSERVMQLLRSAGLPAHASKGRGWDHGVFIPLKVAVPEADIPTVAISLAAGLDPALHWRVGDALRPLRDEGVLIVGSGMSYHNMRGFNSGAGGRLHSEAFDRWLRDAVQKPERERKEALFQWASAPSARECHPREEHLLPLMVCAGAGGVDPGKIVFSDVVMGVRVSGVQFG